MRRRLSQADTVIYDDATKLTWQGGNEWFPQRNWQAAKAYVDSLNTLRYAGSKDWRLPTLKEAMSVTEPGLKMDLLFRDTPIIWTTNEYAWTDKGDVTMAWVVNFYEGLCWGYSVSWDVSVRAVR